MTTEQISEHCMRHNSDIAALWESVKSAHKRINDSDEITKGIHEIAASVKALALQVKLLTDRLDENVDKLEESLQRQGQRIGALEKEPADKWKRLVAQIVGLIVAALMGGVLSNLF